MSGKYLGQFSGRQCQIQSPRDTLGELKVLEGIFIKNSKLCDISKFAKNGLLSIKLYM